MSTFVVNPTAPTQLYQGGQDTVTIVNDGPNTIYLGSDTSVGPLNGFTLAPTGQMTWKGLVPLFAVTQQGQSRVITDISGDLSLTTRASYFRRLAPSVIKSVGPVTVETGWCQTIQLQLQPALGGGGSGPQFTDIPAGIFEWLNDDGIVVYTENVFWNGFSLNNLAMIQLPVKGSFCRITLVPVASAFPPTAFPYSKWDIFGTDRVLPAKLWDAVIAAASSSSGDATRVDDTVFVTSFPLGVLVILLPSLGDTLSIYSHQGVTVAGDYEIASRETGCTYGTIHFAVGARNQVVGIPVSRTDALIFQPTTTPPTGGSGGITFKYDSD